MIDTLLSKVRAGITLEIPSVWGQGRTAYGGLSTAMLNRAMLNELSKDIPLRLHNTQFIGPLLLEEPFIIEVEHLRDGKNVTQLQARIMQNGTVAVQSIAAFGADRESFIEVLADKVELGPVPSKANWVIKDPKLAPNFLAFFELSTQKGGYPFTGKSEPVYDGWMRFFDTYGPITDAHILALIDLWPPTVLQMLTIPAMGSTLSWNVEFIHPRPVIVGDEWLAYRCITRQAAGGYSHTEASIYTANGQLVAISRQTVTVFG